MPGRWLKAASAVTGALLVGGSVAPAAAAKTSCAYSGAPANVLTVTISGDLDTGVIERNGLNIAASDYGEAPQPCSGGTPTVLNTDAIVVRAESDSSVDVRLGGGPFAPGTTPEADGAPEIEITIYGELLQTVIGTRGDDEFQWGPGGAHAGLNLNPRSAGDQDVDVTVSGENGFLVADGAAGADTIIAQPRAALDDGIFSTGGSGNDLLRTPRGSGGILEGGPGDDVIVGSRHGDLLKGETGNDRVSGGGGADDIDGGRGRDRLSGGAGRDVIDSRDARRDTVSCGRGRDRVKADRSDRLRGCEAVRTGR